MPCHSLRRRSTDAATIGSVKKQLRPLGTGGGRHHGSVEGRPVALSARAAAQPPFQGPQPLIDFAGRGLCVVQRRTAFSGSRRFAGVSSFGFGGTNAHVALAASPDARRLLVPIEAEDPAGIAQRAAERLSRLTAAGSLDTADTAPDWPAGRAGDRPALRAVAAGESVADPSPPAAAERPGAGRDACWSGATRLVWFFSGHGGQWPGMASDLLAAEPTFCAALSECDQAVAAVAGFHIIEELAAPPATSRLHRTDILQPVIFGIQVALACTLMAWGLRPDAVYGQSIGEVAAAVVAGALSLAEGARVIALWSAVVHDERASGRGGMVLCDLCLEDAERFTRTLPAAALGQGICRQGMFASRLRKPPRRALPQRSRRRAKRVHRIQIDYPCHSPQMAALCPRTEPHGTGPVRSCAIPMVSTVHGQLLPGSLSRRLLGREHGNADGGCRGLPRPLREGVRIVEIGRMPWPCAVSRRRFAPAAGKSVVACCRLPGSARPAHARGSGLRPVL